MSGHAAFQSGPVLGLNDFLARVLFRHSADTDAASQMEVLFLGILYFSAFWFILLMGLMVFFVIKYRRRPGVPAAPSPSHNNKLEIFWTVVPSMALLPMFLFGFWGYMTSMTPSGEAIDINITAWKWAWKMTYPNGVESSWTKPLDAKAGIGEGGGMDFPVFVLPEDTDITLKMISRDVIHSFWIPDQRIKMDVYPNRYTGYTFHTPTLTEDDFVDHPESGEPMYGRDMWVFCAEYCGAMHSEMAATIRVVPQADYERIITEDFSTGDLTPVEIGQRLYKTSCVACHTVNGGPSVGPSWLDTFGTMRPIKGGGEALMDANYLRESILDPQAKIVDGFVSPMPSFDGQVSEEQIEGLIAYFKSLSAQGGADDAGDETTEQDHTGEQPEAEAEQTP